MSDSDLGNAGIIQQAIRGVGAILDKIFFGLLVVVFQIFFNVASAELFTGESILKFVGRVQLILGVFTMFQLAMSILKGIVNPDQFFSKDKGFSNVITKVVIALFLLALIMPISISGAKNEYEKQVNNNGILFGTLYSLQHRLLSNNTLGRLILGSDKSSSTFMGDDESELESASNIFASTILKTFIKINLVEEKDRTHADGKTDDQISSNWVCSDMNDYVDVYKQDDVDPGTLLNLVGDTCGSDDRGNVAEFVSTVTASDYFKFTYSPFISTIVAGIFAFILLGFCVDVAIRAVKLSVLRIIAPVPILSYMNPSGGKDGSLNSWIKTLTSTYLDLFIRLAVVYFAIFLIMDIISEGIVINIGFTENPLIGGVSTVLIFLGIFFFAKEAPKFFKDMLGLKGDSSMFGGISGIGKALGIGAAGLGIIGSARAGYLASKNADETNGASTTGFAGMWNRGKHLVAGIAGGVAGGYTGVNAAMTAKDHALKSTLDAMSKRNANNIARGSNGSTSLGRAVSTGQRLLFGRDAYEKQSSELSLAKARENAAKDLYGYLDGKGKTDYSDRSVSTKIRDGFTVNDSVNSWNRKVAQAKADERRGGQGLVSVSYTDAHGNTATREINVNDADISKIGDQLGYEAGRVWADDQETIYSNWVANGRPANDPNIPAPDNGYIQKRDDYAFVADSGREFDSGEMDAVNKLKKTSKIAGGAATHIERSRDYGKHKADHGASGGSGK